MSLRNETVMKLVTRIYFKKQKGKEYGNRKTRSYRPRGQRDNKVYRKYMKRSNELLNNFNPTSHLVEVIEGDIQMG